MPATPAAQPTSAAARPTFLLGAGAQKAGTSWLHDHLAASPQCAEGYRKEYHVFDALDLPTEQWKVDNIAQRARREARRAVAGEPVDASALHRASMLYEPLFYFDHFVGLLARDPRTTMTLDMTPDYAMLSAERLRWVRDGFAARGVRTVSVFLMRDPVERIWSHIRMEKSRRPQRYPGDSAEHLREVFAHPTYAARTRYDHTLRVLDEVFEPDELHHGFYETLFTAEQVRAVSELVGIEPRTASFDKRVNASPKASAVLPEDVERTVAEHYREVYVAVARRFPDVDLPQIWPSARFVLG